MITTLQTALTSPLYALARGALRGCPEGSWPETQQARVTIEGELPPPRSRDFTVGAFIAAAYTLDQAGRYQPR
jgi:hypothetical protein